jgi:hypothetical protein
MTNLRAYVYMSLALLLALALAGCGGSTGGPPPPIPTPTPTTNFSITAQPAVVVLAPASSAGMSVSVSGTGGPVSITINGLPAGVSASPGQFSLAIGAQQNVTLTASASAAIASLEFTVSGTAGTVNHAQQVALLINPAQKSAHPPFRTGYVRTDTQWDASFLNFFPQRWIIYDAPTRRFFATSTFLNRVDVIDAKTEQVIAEIPVPGAFVGDETPDHSAIYMGTQVGDVYKIDPVSMQVLQRYPAVQIGPNGFPAYEVRVLADGRLVLLGSQGGIPAVDGYSSLAIWNPADNSFFIAPRFAVLPGCPITGGIVEFALTADRTKVLLGSGVSGAALCSYDPVTDAQVAVATDPLGIGVSAILTPSDGQEIIVPGGSTVNVFDANGLFPTDTFQVGTGTGLNFFNYLLSLDGNTLYVLPKGAEGGTLLAYNWRTHQLIGWAPMMDLLDLGVGPYPDAIDETGLITAVAPHGISFLDAGAIHLGPPTSVATNTFVSPSFGPAAGDTNVTFTFIATPATTTNVFFGNQLTANVTPVGEGVSVTSPPGAPGPVDVTALLPDGNLVIAPESFSYGPSIVEVTTDSTTAEGGATGTISGYGFGNARFGGQEAAGLQVLVNGQAASNLQYSPNPLDSVSEGPAYLFPIESIDFTFPQGTAGQTADLVVSDSAGSVTAAHAIQYLSPSRRFPLTGSQLVQGIYDSKRDVYYFSDTTRVQVFSRTQGAFLAPINMPSGAQRLWGLALSPDGSKLAVSDAIADRIYVLDPDTPATIKTFGASAATDPAGGSPGGLAITDAGNIYYMMFYVELTGPPGLHKLNTVTGTITPFQSIAALALGDDSLTRVLLSSDNARVYINTASFFVELDTATDTLFSNPVIPNSDYELALSSNQTWMSGTGWLMDTNLNPESFITLTDRQAITSVGVFGAKLNSDGSLFFQPLTGGIDVFDGKTGTLRNRIALPFSLSANYDALVSDGKDNVLLAIVGQEGDGGVAVIDLSSLPEPLSLGLRPAGGVTPRKLAAAGPGTSNKTPTAGANPRSGPLRLPHVVNSPTGKGNARMLR